MQPGSPAGPKDRLTTPQGSSTRFAPELHHRFTCTWGWRAYDLLMNERPRSGTARSIRRRTCRSPGRETRAQAGIGDGQHRVSYAFDAAPVRASAAARTPRRAAVDRRRLVGAGALVFVFPAVADLRDAERVSAARRRRDRPAVPASVTPGGAPHPEVGVSRRQRHEPVRALCSDSGSRLDCDSQRSGAGAAGELLRVQFLRVPGVFDALRALRAPGAAMDGSCGLRINGDPGRCVVGAVRRDELGPGTRDGALQQSEPVGLFRRALRQPFLGLVRVAELAARVQGLVAVVRLRGNALPGRAEPVAGGRGGGAAADAAGGVAEQEGAAGRAARRLPVGARGNPVAEGPGPRGPGRAKIPGRDGRADVPRLRPAPEPPGVPDPRRRRRCPVPHQLPEP